MVWFIDLPRKRATLDGWARQWPRRPVFVLHIMESPLLFPHAFEPRNRNLFDAVVSYENQSQTTPWFPCPLPVDSRPSGDGAVPFAKRKLAVMINTNRYEGWLATRKKGWTGLPGIGRVFSGWSIPTRSLLRPAHGELYSWRRKLAQEFTAHLPLGLDIYGSGWSGEVISWLPFLNRHVCPARQNKTVATRAAKLRVISQYKFTIAAENYRGGRGYISEKIFEALLGQTVPVYLGEEAIEEAVPSSCFVDARHFASLNALIRHLESMTEETWQSKFEAGRAFLASKDFQRYTCARFAARMNQISSALMPPVERIE